MPASCPPHIVFSGGVTGGHLYPGLAVAAAIQDAEPAARITFAGPGGKDRQAVGRAGHSYLQLACPKAPRNAWRLPSFAQQMFQSQWTAGSFLRDNTASAVVGLGGFASVPMALAARRCRVPLILMEQNAVLGRANRWLAQRADTLCLAFRETMNLPSGLRHSPIVTGTPIRAEFCHANWGQTRDAAERVLLVVGGSGGARDLNEALPLALCDLASFNGWRVVHQTGEAGLAATSAAYQRAGIDARVVSFFVDMPAMLRQAALVVARAGGSTLAELAVAQIPAVLVPFPQATDDHQRQNAIRFAQAGAAILVDRQGLPIADLARRLALTLSPLLAQEALRQNLAASLASLAKPHAAQRIASKVLEVAFQADRKVTSHGATAAIPPALPTLN